MNIYAVSPCVLALLVFIRLSLVSLVGVATEVGVALLALEAAALEAAAVAVAAASACLILRSSDRRRAGLGAFTALAWLRVVPTGVVSFVGVCWRLDRRSLVSADSFERSGEAFFLFSDSLAGALVLAFATRGLQTTSLYELFEDK